MSYILIILLILILLIFAVSYFVFNLGICRNSSKDLVFKNKINKSVIVADKCINKDYSWFYKERKEVSITTQDGIKLQGYSIKNKDNDNWVLIVHGFTSNHLEMLNRAKCFNDLGYNVMLFDLRGHGKSEGKYITMGIKDCFDVKEWCNYLVSKMNAKKIVLFGISMGASTVMMALDKGLPKEVSCAIEDCGYSSTYEEYKYQFKNLFHLPAFPFLDICNLYCILIAGFNFKSDSAIKSIKNSKIPLLMIHGTKDTFVPYYMLDIIYENCASKKEKFVVEGASHTEAQDLDYDNYWKTIENFIK